MYFQAIDILFISVHWHISLLINIPQSIVPLVTQNPSGNTSNCTQFLFLSWIYSTKWPIQMGQSTNF